MNAVILAGGQGTRLWPMSRRNKPKQFFELLSEHPLIVDAYHRLRPRFEPSQIHIATIPEFAEMIAKLLPEIPQENYFIEPHKRDSGPAMAFAAFSLKKLGKGDEPVVFIPTDHFIAQENKFLDALAVGEQLIQETGKMLDIAILPRFASTELGYTQIGASYGKYGDVEVFQFASHKEKPDRKTALGYIQSGSYLWHANYYMWTPSLLLEAYGKYAPEIASLLEEISAEPDHLEEIYGRMPVRSIDYAVTEKMDPFQVLIIRGDFGWSDIGTWNVLYDRLSELNGEDGNVVKGKTVTIDSNRNLIYGSNEKLIATIGIHDMIIVDTKDGLLICPQSRASEVKTLLAKVEHEGLEDYL